MSNPPNIVFVFCDQLRYGTLGCEDNTVCRTPNIDRFDTRARDERIHAHKLGQTFTHEKWMRK